MAARSGLDPARQSEFILLLPAGRPTAEHYLPDFMAFVNWYEERLLDDLAYLLENYSADPERIFLGGYSLGGDLSWALSVRNPSLFAGAVIAGTRASHPATADALTALRERGFRGAFLIGDREDPARYNGINHARALFAASEIEHRYAEYPGGHIMPEAVLLQQKIRYVTSVRNLPDPSVPTVAGRAGQAVAPFGHTSRDRFALRFAFPIGWSSEGIDPPDEFSLGVRWEWPWDNRYIRTTGTYERSTRTTEEREHRLQQDILFGWGEYDGFFGAGLGFDWVRAFDDGNSYGELDLLLFRADRDPWIIPSGRVDPQRVDSLLLVRYTVPRGVGSGVRLQQVLNLRAEYLLRISDWVVLDAGVGAYTVQNRPVDTISDLRNALDHRLEWQVGTAVRLPSPFLWRIGHRGVAERPLPDGSFDYRGIWNVSIEYSF